MIRVTAGQSINQAIRDNPGVDIILEAGATFTEVVQLNDRGGTITGEAGTKLGSGTVEPAITGFGASGWDIYELELLPNKDGMANVVHLEDAVDIVFDGIKFTGGPKGQRRVILGNGQAIGVFNCEFRNIWREGEESNAFCAYRGAGPYTIQDSFFEVAGINVLFGGAPSKSEEELPSEVVIFGNHFYKDPAWKGTPKVVKNHLEFKVGRHVLIESNTFENNWTMGQSGWSLVLTPNDDEFKCPWNIVEDVLVINNNFIGCEHGINILGHDWIGVSQQTKGIRILSNDFGRVWWALQVGNEAGDIEFGMNRGQVGEYGAVLVYDGNVMQMDGTRRPAAYGIETFYYYDNQVSNPRIHGQEFVKNLIAAPMPDPEPKPIPEPEPALTEDRVREIVREMLKQAANSV